MDLRGFTPSPLRGVNPGAGRGAVLGIPPQLISQEFRGDVLMRTAPSLGWEPHSLSHLLFLPYMTPRLQN